MRLIGLLTKSYHRVDTQGDAGADDLDTINGGTEGDILILVGENVARVTTVRDGTGNITIGSDYVLSAASDQLTLIYDGTNWMQVSRV